MTRRAMGPLLLLVALTWPASAVAEQTDETACAAGDPAACDRAAQRRFPTVGFDPSPAEVGRMATQACIAGFPRSCFIQGALHASGFGLAQDPGAAQLAYERACNLGSRAGGRSSKKMGGTRPGSEKWTLRWLPSGGQPNSTPVTATNSPRAVCRSAASRTRSQVSPRYVL